MLDKRRRDKGKRRYIRGVQRSTNVSSREKTIKEWGGNYQRKNTRNFQLIEYRSLQIERTHQLSSSLNKNRPTSSHILWKCEKMKS